MKHHVQASRYNIRQSLLVLCVATVLSPAALAADRLVVVEHFTETG